MCPTMTLGGRAQAGSVYECKHRHADTQARKHSITQARKHANMQARKHASTQACTQPSAQERNNTIMQACKGRHARAHTPAHAHMLLSRSDKSHEHHLGFAEEEYAYYNIEAFTMMAKHSDNNTANQH